MPLFPKPLRLYPSYVYGMVDTPGVVASNNFLSVFNPSGSTIYHFPIEVGMTCSSTALTEVASSLAMYRTTAASGGTLVSTSNLVKFQTNTANAQAEVRIGNPTVTRTNNTPIAFAPPIITDKLGNTGTVTVTAPVQTPLGLALAPGEGFVFNTASGTTAELWSLIYAWGEIQP